MNNFLWPTGKCLGRGSAPINGCNNLRFKDGNNELTSNRQILNKSFGNYIINDSAPTVPLGQGAQLLDTVDVCSGSSGPGILTPFRRAMNAGDPYATVNMAPNNTLYPKPSNQVAAPRGAALAGWGVLAGSGLKTTQGGSAFTGNPKYVYDGSDYTRFKKLQAQNRNYNDPNFGGDNNNASQVALSRVHRAIAGI